MPPATSIFLNNDPTSPGYRRIDFKESAIKIGQTPRCELRLDDLAVSRLHAIVEINQDGSEIVILDLGSASGTFVNERKVQKSVVGPRDVVRVGNTKLQIAQTVIADHPDRVDLMEPLERPAPPIDLEEHPYRKLYQERERIEPPSQPKDLAEAARQLRTMQAELQRVKNDLHRMTTDRDGWKINSDRLEQTVGLRDQEIMILQTQLTKHNRGY